MSDSRALFDAVIETYSETSDKLSSTAGIVHSVAFENAIVKLQRGNSSSLLYEESEAVKSLKGESSTSFEIVNEDLSFAERALKDNGSCMRNPAKITLTLVFWSQHLISVSVYSLRLVKRFLSEGKE